MSAHAVCAWLYARRSSGVRSARSIVRRGMEAVPFGAIMHYTVVGARLARSIVRRVKDAVLYGVYDVIHGVGTIYAARTSLALWWITWRYARCRGGVSPPECAARHGSRALRWYIVLCVVGNGFIRFEILRSTERMNAFRTIHL